MVETVVIEFAGHVHFEAAANERLPIGDFTATLQLQRRPIAAEREGFPLLGCRCDVESSRRGKNFLPGGDKALQESGRAVRIDATHACDRVAVDGRRRERGGNHVSGPSLGGLLEWHHPPREGFLLLAERLACLVADRGDNLVRRAVGHLADVQPARQFSILGKRLLLPIQYLRDERGGHRRLSGSRQRLHQRPAIDRIVDRAQRWIRADLQRKLLRKMLLQPIALAWRHLPIRHILVVNRALGRSVGHDNVGDCVPLFSARRLRGESAGRHIAVVFRERLGRVGKRSAAEFPIASIERHTSVEPNGLARATREDAADAKRAPLDLFLSQPVTAVVGRAPRVEPHASKSRAVWKVVGRRQHGGDLRIGIADRGLKAPHVAVARRAAKVGKGNLDRRHPASHRIPHHAAAFHAGLPRLMRLPDLRQVAIDAVHAARVGHDAVDSSLRGAPLVARIDEQLEHIVRRHSIRRLSCVGARLAPHRIGHAKQQRELLGVVGDIEIGKIAIARIANRPDRRVNESGKARGIAQIALNIDCAARQRGDAIGSVGHRQEGRRISRHATVQLRQIRDRAGLGGRGSRRQRHQVQQRPEAEHKPTPAGPLDWSRLSGRGGLFVHAVILTGARAPTQVEAFARTFCGF